MIKNQFVRGYVIGIVSGVLLYSGIANVAHAQQPQQQATGYDVLAQKLAASQKDTALLYDRVNAMQAWHDACVKDFKKCEEEYKKEKEAEAKVPASPAVAPPPPKK